MSRKLKQIADDLRVQIEARQVPLRVGNHKVMVWWSWEGMDDYPKADEVYVSFNADGSYPEITATVPGGRDDDDLPMEHVMPILPTDEALAYLRALSQAQTWYCAVMDEDRLECADA